MEPQNIGGFLSRLGAGIGRGVLALGTGGISELGMQRRDMLAQQEQLAAQQEAQQRQALAQIIASPMTPDQKLQALAQLGTADAVAYAQELAKPADVPASIKEFQAVQAMIPEQRAAFQAMQNPITPFQREQLALERAKLESGADFQRMQANQRAQALELQARALEQAGRRQEAAAVRAEAKAVATVEPRELSATEQKEFYEAEDRASAATGVIGALNDALAINDKAFSGFTAETRAFLNRVPGVGAFIPDEGATATTELNNIILSQALESLKVTFGAAPTEGERKILIDLQASVDKTPAERKRILERALAAAQRREKSARAKMEGITTGGIYGRQVEAQEPATPTPAAGGITLPAASAIEAELRRRGAM
jgi:hypothetical protein